MLRREPLTDSVPRIRPRSSSVDTTQVPTPPARAGRPKASASRYTPILSKLMPIRQVVPEVVGVDVVDVGWCRIDDECSTNSSSAACSISAVAKDRASSSISRREAEVVEHVHLRPQRERDAVLGRTEIVVGEDEILHSRSRDE